MYDVLSKWHLSAYARPRLRFIDPPADPTPAPAPAPAPAPTPDPAPAPAPAPTPAPAPAPAPAPTDPPAPAPGTPTDPNTVQDGDVNSLPPWARKAISDANAQAAKNRVDARDAQEKAYRKIGVELGLVEEDESKLTPEELAERLRAGRTTDAATIAEQQATITTFRREKAVQAAAAAHGGDDTLLVSYLNGMPEFTTLDVNAPEYADQVSALVLREVTKYPKLKAAQVAPSSGPDAIPSGDTPPVELAGIEARRAERQKRRGVTTS